MEYAILSECSWNAQENTIEMDLGLVYLSFIIFMIL